MPKKLKYLFLHCSATPEGRDLKPVDIELMHLAPLINANGTFTYKGKVYKRRTDIPDDMLGQYHVRNYSGRGWKTVGYTRVITLDGGNHVMKEHDDDEWVEANEITNGAAGYNDVGRHIVYIGGMDKLNKVAKDTRTPEQSASLEKYVKDVIARYPDIKVIGHNQVANKACPSFSVPKWLKSIGVSDKNIATVDAYGYAKKFA